MLGRCKEAAFSYSETDVSIRQRLWRMEAGIKALLFNSLIVTYDCGYSLIFTNILLSSAMI